MSVAEMYQNRLYHLQPSITIPRCWVNPNVMVGGSIVDKNDWVRIQEQHGLGAVLNLEAGTNKDGDKGIDPANLYEIEMKDDGKPNPVDLVKAVKFANTVLGRNLKLYVHGTMGGSRSIAVAYMILRRVYQMPPEAALKTIRDEINDQKWGLHPAHDLYMKAVEATLKDFDAIASKLSAAPAPQTSAATPAKK